MKNLIKIIVLPDFLASMAYVNSSIHGIYFRIGGALSALTKDIVVSRTHLWQN
jgi:hypothetical protein